MQNLLAEYLNLCGFEAEVMGGGVESLSLYFPHGTHILATGTDGAGMPDPHDWMLGVYGPIGDTSTDALWLRMSGEKAAHNWKRHAREAIACAEAVDRLRMFDRNALAASAPPMSIEVSPIRRDGDGWTTTDEGQAVGFGVYLRNPLALHLSDFLIPDWQDATAAALLDAKRAAFRWARAVAEHIGCTVDGEAPPEEVPLGDLMHAAACLWEAALELHRDMSAAPIREANPAQAEFLREWEDMGTVHVRMMVTGWAEECERDWLRERDGFSGAYDWEWCPAWLAFKLRAVYPAPAPVNGRAMLPGDISTGYAGLNPLHHGYVLFAYPAEEQN